MKDVLRGIILVLTSGVKIVDNYPNFCVVDSRIVGENLRISPFVHIEEGAVIGNNVKIHSFVYIGSGVVIGDNCEIFQGAVIGKTAAKSAALSRQIGGGDKTYIGSDCSIGCHAVIYAGTEIGEGVLVGDSASIREECSIGEGTIVGRFVSLNYNVKLGKRVKIMDHSWLAGNMEVGDDVFISGGVLTANDNKIGREGYSKETIIGPTIRDGAVIGVGAILLPNIEIGDHSTVAAGALVSRNVPASSQVFGIPARVREK